MNRYQPVDTLCRGIALLLLVASPASNAVAGRSREDLLAERRRIAADAEVVSYRRIPEACWKRWDSCGNLLAGKIVRPADLKMSIVRPPAMAADGLYPAILLFHGGGFRSGSPEQFLVQAEYFANRGMIAFCVEYRLKDKVDVTIAEQLEDARAAIRWVREQAKALRIDPEKVVAGGGSAGGYLALASAVIVPPGPVLPSPVPDALVLYNPAIDFYIYAAESGVQQIEESLGGPLDQFSCTPNLRPGLPPILLFQGEEDEKTPVAGARKFTARARELGNVCELVTFPGEAHAFHNRDPFIEGCAQQAISFLISQGFSLRHGRAPDKSSPERVLSR